MSDHHPREETTTSPYAARIRAIQRIAVTLTPQACTYMFLPPARLFPSPDTRGTPSCIHITSSSSISLQRAVGAATTNGMPLLLGS